MRAIIWLFLLIFLLLSKLVFAQGDFPDFEKSIYVVGKDTLPYRFLKPLKYDKSKKYPLVVFFHGAGERGNDNQITLNHIAPLFLNEVNRQNYPCFVLITQCPKNIRWVDTDWKLDAHTQPEKPSTPLKMTYDLLEKLEVENAVDNKRLYVTGISMGGFATWDIIARHPKKFACAVPICGGADEKTAKKIKDIPIWTFHGSLDKVVKPERSRNIVKALQAADGHPKFTEYKDVYHDSWKRAYATPELIKWMFEQKK